MVKTIALSKNYNLYMLQEIQNIIKDLYLKEMDLTGKRMPAISTIFIHPWLLLILLSLLSRTTDAQPAPIYRLLDLSCQNTTNFTSTYQANRDTVFSSLSSNATRPIGFYNASSGTRPNDTVYGIFICRGDLSISDCSACVLLSTYYVAQRCPTATTAGVFYEECLVRYSNRDIASAVDFEPSVSLYTDRNATDLVSFNSTLSSLMNDAVARAANEPPGAKKFATEQGNVSSSQTLYTLAQCQPNLSGRDCSRCLQRTIRNLSDCCSGKIGALVFNPVCTIRYEVFPFYNLTAVNPQSGHNGNGPNRKTVLIASLSSIFGLALVSVCGYLIWGRVRRKIQENIEHTQEIRLLELIEGRLAKEGQTPDNFSGEHEEEFPSIQLDILLAATNHFSSQNKLGQGGFGPVYKGTLSDGKQIAVKRLSITSGQGLAEFKNEVMLIAKLQHRNLVRLFGCCVERNENLLVYEYMPKRSMDLYIFDSNLACQLDWPKRFNIIKGIARGIMYLHEDSRLRIIHRDLKTSNVLLDDNMNPKISDFGMARIFGEDKKEAITRRVVGTYGYMAPEYAMEGLFSVKSDVFSFGVIVLEIISGKKNNGFHHAESGESLLTYAWKLWSKGEGMELVNQLHVQSCVPSEVLKCIHIGLLCVQEDAADRPTMSTVIFMLASDDTIALPRPTEPAFSVGRAIGKQSESYPFSSDGIFSVNEVTITNFLPR